MIARYLGLTVSGERALADAFVLVGLRHAAEPEMRNAGRLHSNWCNEHLDALRPAMDRYVRERSAEGERLRQALFRGRRRGGFGLLRDLHDLLALASCGTRAGSRCARRHVSGANGHCTPSVTGAMAKPVARSDGSRRSCATQPPSHRACRARRVTSWLPRYRPRLNRRPCQSGPGRRTATNPPARDRRIDGLVRSPAGSPAKAAIGQDRALS